MKVAELEGPALDFKKEGRTYISWSHMMDRCYNKNSTQYRWYGARGITVCERWHCYGQFLTDMGVRPVGTTIDRMESTGMYEPVNCRWATHTTQCRNRRSNIKITRDGKTQTLKEWTAVLGLPYKTVWWRHRKGWPADKLFSSISRAEPRPDA